MTTIVAVENDGHVLIGSDTQVTSGYQKESLGASKVVTNGEYFVAVAGRLRMLQEIRHADLPAIPEDVHGASTDRFVNRVLCPFVQKLEKFANCENESHYLFILRNRVYFIGGDGTYMRNSSGAYAIGSGSPYALGALTGLTSYTKDDIARALLAAANNDVFTAAPFNINKVVQ